MTPSAQFQLPREVWRSVFNVFVTTTLMKTPRSSRSVRIQYCDAGAPALCYISLQTMAENRHDNITINSTPFALVSCLLSPSYHRIVRPSSPVCPALPDSHKHFAPSACNPNTNSLRKPHVRTFTATPGDLQQKQPGSITQLLRLVYPSNKIRFLISVELIPSLASGISVFPLTGTPMFVKRSCSLKRNFILKIIV